MSDFPGSPFNKSPSDLIRRGDGYSFLDSGLDAGKMNFPGDQASKGSPEESEGRGSLPADRQAHFSEIAPSPCLRQEPHSDIFSDK